MITTHMNIPWDQLGAVGDRAFEEAVTEVVLDIRERAGDIGSGSLADKVERRSIRVGSVAEVNVDHPAAFVEFSTRPHVIRARRALSLAWEDGGELHFARSVNHPGTDAQPFIGPATDRFPAILRWLVAARLSGLQSTAAFGLSRTI